MVYRFANPAQLDQLAHVLFEPFLSVLQKNVEGISRNFV
jgi:hypothetical protein